MNECLDNNGRCDQRCVNSVGSYECACDGGYMLDESGRKCIRKFFILELHLSSRIEIVILIFSLPNYERFNVSE